MVANVGELFSGYLPFRFPLSPSPKLSWQDGLLEIVVLAPRNPPELAMLLWKAAHRKFGGDDRLIHFQAREITIDANPPIAVQIDGDPAGTTPVSAMAVPAAMQVLIPRPA
jgi:diacylglycerol kinase family enzyme